MSAYEKMASAIKPPTEGNVSVLAITTSASAAQDTGIATGGPARYVTFIADVACFITFAGNGTNTVTDPDGTAVSAGGRTWRLAADQPTAMLVSSRERHFKARGTGSGYLRWYISSV